MKVPQTSAELGEMLRDVDYIASEIRRIRSEMATDGPDAIEIDKATAQGYLVWLKNWVDGFQVSLRKARVRGLALKKRAEIEELKKSQKRKS